MSKLILKFKKRYKLFLALFLISMIFSTIFTSAQQVLRLDANDPQIQLAEDIAAQLNKGAKPAELVKGDVDIATSLAPFVIIYDKSGKVVVGSGRINDEVPIVPHATLKYTDSGRNNRVTWKPIVGMRIASVVYPAKDYYVLTGRNLREVESREGDILKIVTFSWVISVIFVWVLFNIKDRNKPVETYGKPSKPRSHKK